MPTYLTPGVYVEEVPSASKPIEGVGTSIAAFVGLAPGGPVNVPMRILDKETRSLMLELHRIGGRVLDGDGEPVANAWVVLAGAGWTATNKDGQFQFQNVPPGTYQCSARGPDGNEISAEVEVPGSTLDLTLGSGSRKPAKRRS